MTKCGYIGCSENAFYRGRTLYPDEEIFRCQDHAGHHNFTHKWIKGRWQKWEPSHVKADRKYREKLNRCPF